MTATRTSTAALLIAAALAGPADAATLRWARSADAATLDPHARNEGVTHGLNQHVYEALASRNRKGELVPGLAASWRMLPEDPSVWEFKLRQGVRFHDGSAFDAEDVVFSLQRAMAPTSDMRGLLTSVESVTRADASTVRVRTRGPNPLLVNNLTNVFIMDREWTEANGAAKPQDMRTKDETHATRHANGTGPFSLVTREPGLRTVLRRNEAYWGRGEVPLEVSEIVYTPIRSDADRVAALASGGVDLIQDVPVEAIERLRGQPGLRVTTGPENRTVFLGMDVGSADLRGDDVEGRNPFADRRVRRALDMAVDREAIRRDVMRGQAVPAGVVMAPFVRGWTPELDRPTAFDPAGARALLAEAGLPKGFAVTLHCTNDRYVNDEALCRELARGFGEIGVTARVVSQSRTVQFPMIQKNPPETEFYLFGWGSQTFDSEYILSFLYHGRDGSRGSRNASRYADPEVDGMIRSLASETDAARRDATAASLWAKLKGETILIPLHHQMLAYGMKAGIEVPVDAEDQPNLKYVSVKAM